MFKRPQMFVFQASTRIDRLTKTGLNKGEMPLIQIKDPNKFVRLEAFWEVLFRVGSQNSQ